jgi:hypothetical protein
MEVLRRRRKFSVTSGTLFHSRKLVIRDYWQSFACSRTASKARRRFRCAGTSTSTRNQLLSFCTSCARQWRQRFTASVRLVEAGRQVEIEGAYFGDIRQANRKADRRRAEKPRRKVLVIARERHGQAIPWVVSREAGGVPVIRQHIASGTEVHADESGAWNVLLASYPMKRVNHSVEYKSEDGASTNWGESYFSRPPSIRIRHSPSNQQPSAPSLRRRIRVAREPSP